MAKFIPVVSSKMTSLKYDRAQSKLVVQFGESTFYEYDNVPGDVVLDFLFADSIGSAFSAMIEKQGYAYRRIPADEAIS